MTPTQKRLIFPLRGPRYQTLAWWPVHTFAAAVQGYHEAFFAVLNPSSVCELVQTAAGSKR